MYNRGKVLLYFDFFLFLDAYFCVEFLNEMKANKYYIIAFLSFFMWGFFSLALKPIAHESSFDVLFFRILLSVFLTVALAATIKRKTIQQSIAQYREMTSSVKKKAIGYNVLGGTLLGLNWFLFIYVVNQISVQTASYAYLICPIITSILSFLILKEQLQKVQWLAIVLCLAGSALYYVSNPNNLLFAIIVASTYSFYLISQKKNVFFDKFTTLVLQLSVILLIALPYYFYHGFHFPSEVSFYVYILIIATCFTVIPLYMNLYALQGVSASTVGILIYVNPIITFLLSIFYFKEPIKVLQIISYLLILFSIFIFNIKLFAKSEK